MLEILLKEVTSHKMQCLARERCQKEGLINTLSSQYVKKMIIENYNQGVFYVKKFLTKNVLL